ncbi:hypothetical protein B0H13DRAFT_1899995 [Mycena leptocephala]|nr:hypothetical protein B0H13DRAFT_1899995 [Mycena leptocephala]
MHHPLSRETSGDVSSSLARDGSDASDYRAPTWALLVSSWDDSRYALMGISGPDNNPFIGFFTGMINQFMRDSMANGSLLAALAANTPPASSSSAPLPTFQSHLPSRYNTTQPMLGMGGLGIPVSGHSNNLRRRVEELSPTQLSETNVTRRSAAREHLGPAGAASNFAAVVTVMAQAFQPGQSVTYYKNYTSAFSQFARDSHLLFEYTVMKTTKITTLLSIPLYAVMGVPDAHQQI